MCRVALSSLWEDHTTTRLDAIEESESPCRGTVSSLRWNSSPAAGCYGCYIETRIVNPVKGSSDFVYGNLNGDRAFPRCVIGKMHGGW
ncbi:hypothetical protein K0M31_018320 [Melipona bicolor]|uniref:Uncharacterized protein n=1 Tax=Melipona bicolor TaxID=60889 RepID=A0AA40KRL3_9HYME|nr:hypothetical protein K0M31_018320 [Melipona bicolor]